MLSLDTTQQALVAASSKKISWLFKISVAGQLAVQSLEHGHNLDQATITEEHSLAVQKILHAQAVDALSLTQKHDLAVQSLLHAQAIETPAFTTCSGNYGITATDGTERIINGTGRYRGTTIDLDCDGDTITSISVYLKDCHVNTQRVQFAIYEYDGTLDAGNRLYLSGPLYDASTNGTFAWVTDTGINLTIPDGTTKLWLVIQGEEGATTAFQYHDTAAESFWRDGTWPTILDPITGEGASSYNIGGYITIG